MNFLNLLSISCMAVLLAEASGIIQWIKFEWNIPRLKPLDCPMCLAFWIAILFFAIQKQWSMAPFYAAFCSILSILISKLLRHE